MKKQFLFNIFLLVLLNALIKPFWVFGIDRTVQNVVGSEAYGLYFALFNFSILFNSFLDFGLTNFNNRSISQSPGLIAQYFPKLIVTKLLLGVVYLLLCIFVSTVFGYSKEAVKLIGILAVNQFIASMLLFFRSNISGLQLYTADSILSVIDRFLMIIFCSLFLWTNLFPFRISIYVFALLQTLAYSLTCVVAIFIVIKKCGSFNFRNISLFSTDLIKKSLPFALLGMLMVIYTRIDAVLLERLLPDGAIAAGIYAQSFRIFDAITMISVLFASLLLPMFAKLLSGKDEIKPLIKLAFSLLFSGTAILAINLAVFASPILNVLYKEFYPDSVQVFILLSLCIVPVSLTYIFGTLLTADGKLKSLNIIAAVTLLVNIILNLCLIPHLGILGAALSAIISQYLTAILQIIICKRMYNINFSLKNFLSFLLLFIFTFLFAIVLNNQQMDLWIKLVVSVSVPFGVAFGLRIINLREIINALNPERV